MPFDIKNDFPKQLLANTETNQFMSVIDEFFKRRAMEIGEIADLLLDPSKMPEHVLNLKLKDWGFYLRGLELTENQKRKLITLMPIIYRYKGTIAGIVNLIRLLLGIEISVTTEDFSGDEVWVMDESVMDETTIISIPNPTSYLLITYDGLLTTIQIANIKIIVDFMRVAGTQVIYSFPSSVDSVFNFWVIDESSMDDFELFTDNYNKGYEQNYPYQGTRRTNFVN